MHLFAPEDFPRIEEYAKSGLLGLCLRASERSGMLIGDDPERLGTAVMEFGTPRGLSCGGKNGDLWGAELVGEALVKAIRACLPPPLPDMALAVQQPWASFLVNYRPDHPVLRRFKNIENREWPLPRQYWGKRVFILASRKPAWDARAVAALGWDDPEALELLPFLPGRENGGVVGMVEFDKAQPNDGGRCRLGECLSPGPWGADDAFHWRITKAWTLPFLPCRGQLKFFPVNYWVRGLGEDVGGWVREIIGGAA